MEYGNEHRLFVQSLLSRGILNNFEVRELFRACCKRYHVDVVDTNKQLAKFMKLCKLMLEPLGMTIKKVTDEDATSSNGGNVFYALCNTLDRSYNHRLQKFEKTLYDLAPKEIDLLKHFVNLILLSDGKQISRNEALNACKDADVKEWRFSLEEGERTIVKLVDKHWLKLCPEQSHVRLAPRFLAEMEPYLLQMRQDAIEMDEDDDGGKEEYVDNEHPGSGVGTCNICNHFVVRCVTCEKCDFVFHRRCANRVQDVGGDDVWTLPSCPNCQGKKSTANSTSSPASKKPNRGRTRRAAAVSSSDDD